VQPDAGGLGEFLGTSGGENDAQGFFDGEYRVVARVGRALPDQGDVELACLQRGQLVGA
jgi:hypothetical protein